MVHIDVTDTARAQWRAGIQRVVVQLLAHLDLPDERIEVVPVVWMDSANGFRTLTAAERRSLSTGATGAGVPVAGPVGTSPGTGPGAAPDAAGLRRALTSAPVRRVRRLLRPVRRLARAFVDRAGLRPALRSLRRRVELHTRDRHLRPLVRRLPAGSVLFEMDSVWNVVEVDRDQLYRRLRAEGVHVAALVYDLLPIEHPEWFEASLVRVFEQSLRAELAHAELVLAISEHSGRAAASWAAGLGLDPPPAVTVTLGADLGGGHVATDGPVELPAELDGVRSVLAVGTVEPRKNHALLLDTFERLWPQFPDVHLVVVGRAGWNNEVVIGRLRRHPEVGRRLHWYEGAGDALLDTLYRNATVVAVPSVTEGFGLPVIEALRAGVPVVSSSGGALPEAGGDLVDLVAPDDREGWVRALTLLLGDAAELAARRERLVGYEPPTWSVTAAEVRAALLERFGNREDSHRSEDSHRIEGSRRSKGSIDDVL